MRGRALTVRPFLLLLTSEMKYADVILPLPLENSYTYSIPTDLEAAVTPGCRVIVHFGKKRYYTAIVMEVMNASRIRTLRQKRFTPCWMPAQY